MSLLIRIIIVLNVILAMFAVPSLAQDDEEDCRRREITIVPYRAVTTKDKQQDFADFQGLMLRSLSKKGEAIYEHLMDMNKQAGQDAQIEQRIEYLIDIRPADWEEDAEDNALKILIRTLSPLKIRKFVDSKAQLAVLDGAVSEKDEKILFDSTIHVGRKRDLFQDERFDVEFRGDPNDIPAFANAHMFYFLYALAKDALHDYEGCASLPVWIKREIITQANSALTDLDEDAKNVYSPVLNQLIETLTADAK